MTFELKPFQQPAPRIEEADVKLADLEQQLADVRSHAKEHLAERGEQPTGQLIDQWHEFLDIDPDLRGRDYTQIGRAS
ncbi:hypothetical protein [Streptomyces sp. NPDC006640]|uniref:hypothetical protein n=1 Tax=unclassified Streptomyces TaxID=2593676 RepID=UPI0036C823BC